MSDSGLEKELHLDVVNPDELQQILLGHFSRASTTGDRVAFGNDQDADRLILRHDRGRLLIEKILNEDIAAVEQVVRENLLEGQLESYAQTVLFSHQHPIKGFFRYQDVFQIVPVPDNAPQPPFAMGDYPCLFQVRYQSSPNPMINTLRIQLRTRELVGILNVLTRGAFKLSTNVLTMAWVLDPHVPEKPLTYSYRQAGYGYDGFSPLIPAFSDTAGMNAIPLIGEDAYYTSMGSATGEELNLPVTLTRDLDGFFGLTDDDAHRFGMACIWTGKVQGAWSTSRSLAFIAAVTAIEALIPKTSDGRQCPECKRALNPGSGSRFKDFLKKYVPADAVTTDLVDRLYKTRSILAHGDYVLHSDVSTAFMSHRSMKEDGQLRALHMIMYHVLRGWLIDAQNAAVLATNDVPTAPPPEP